MSTPTTSLDTRFSDPDAEATAWADTARALEAAHTKQLDGKLRELRFYLGGRPTRITYWIASNRRIILLTVFVKTRQRERREVERARRAYQRCVAERHTVEEN